jgi:hypothetical protein
MFWVVLVSGFITLALLVISRYYKQHEESILNAAGVFSFITLIATWIYTL